MISVERANALACSADFEFEALEYAVNYRMALVSEFRDELRGRIIEVGAGVGQFTSLLAGLPHVHEIVSVEPEPRFCSTFRQRHPGRTLVEGTIDSLHGDLAWDGIVLVNVLEHIFDDVGELGKCYRQLTTKAGHLCLIVPARNELYSLLDQDFGHHRRYTKREMRRKLEQAGFTVVRLHYLNLIGYFGWWLNFRLLKQRHFNVRAVTFFDRMIAPLSLTLERSLLRPPVGQSLVAVAKVPTASSGDPQKRATGESG